MRTKTTHYLQKTIHLTLALLLGSTLYIEPILAPPPPASRVTIAKSESHTKLKKLFEEKGLDYPPKYLYWRVFKSESIMELWAANKPKQSMTLVTSYPICAMSGELGPKRKQGDLQVPEGFYYIDHFNPYSSYYLSLRINYPNTADRAKRQNNQGLGGDIYIHGDCVSEGCMAMNTNKIKEIYWLSSQAQQNGQSQIPVHIFPARLSAFKMNILQQLYGEWEPKMIQFWGSLLPAYRFFEQTQKVPTIYIDAKGNYELGAT